MSFLNSVLSSIDTGDVSLTPPPSRKTSTPDPSVREATKGSGNESSVSQKRKAWDGLRPTGRADKISKPSPATSMRPLPNKFPPPVSKPTMTAPRISSSSSIQPRPSPSTSKSPGIAATNSKPPPKGSYADIMLQAKALQGKAPTNVGMIKHQSVAKEKLSRAQQKRLAEEAKQREQKNKKASLKTGSNGGGSSGGRVKEAILKSRLEKEAKEPTYKGTARPLPRSKTTTSSTNDLAYTGTAGLPSRRGTGKADIPSRRNQGRRAARDEYLGTDEEDEGDFYDHDDGGDYHSDESSDMEAAFMDMQQEEQQALRIAKKEDEEELRLELAAKKEKLERKKKLAALVKPRY